MSRPRVVVSLALAAALGAGPGAGSARAAAPAASCRAEPAGDRVLVQIALRDLFDRELIHLVRLGLRGQLRLEVNLYRRRRLWFDEKRTSEVQESVVLFSRATGGFLLDGRPLADPATLTFPRLALRPGRGGAQAGNHYVQVSARLEVITVKSLGQMATWLVRGAEPGPAPPSSSPVSRSLISYVAADLARTAGAHCQVR